MLAPVEVTPRLSKAFRYSKATDLRCSSVIICFVMAICLGICIGPGPQTRTKSVSLTPEYSSYSLQAIDRTSGGGDSVAATHPRSVRRGLLFRSRDTPETCFPFRRHLENRSHDRCPLQQRCTSPDRFQGPSKASDSFR